MESFEPRAILGLVLHGGLWNLFIATTVVITFALLYSRVEIAAQRATGAPRPSVYAGPRVRIGLGALCLGLAGAALSVGLIWMINQPSDLADGLATALTAPDFKDRLLVATGIASLLTYDFGGFAYLVSELR